MTRSGPSFMALFRWGTALALLLLADGPQSAAANRYGKPPVPRLQEWLAQPLGERYPQIPAQVWEWIDQANALEAKGDDGKAATVWEQVLAWREKAQGPDHPDTAASLNNLGLLYIKERAFAKAEPLLLRALAIRTRILGPDHPFTALSLHNLAWLYDNQSSDAKAEALYLRALVIAEKALGPEHPGLALGLNNLGLLYSSQGDYAKAESLYLRALAIREKAMGSEHPDTATSLNNLAALYISQGAYAKAEPLLRRSLAIKQKVLGDDHPDTATSLNNLAALYDNQGAFAKAEPLYLSALAINENMLGPGHPITATSLNNLAVLYDNQGASAKAEPLHRRALAIREKALGPKHPDTAGSLNNLAELLRLQGSGAKAEPLFLRSLAIYEQALGPDHPTTALSLNNLAKAYLSQGAVARAEPPLRRGIGSQSLFLQREAPLLPQARRQEQIKALGNVWEIPYSLVAKAPDGASLALFTRLNRHGLLQDIERHQAQLGRGSSAQQLLVSQLTALTARLADVNLSEPQRQTLQQERDRVEQELYRQLPALTPRLVDAAQVAAALPADGVLIEFQRFRPYDARQPEARSWGEARYLAMLLFPDGATRAVDLGLAADTDPLIQQALAESLARNRPAGPFWARVSQKVLGPLMPQLVGRRQWFVSPDGELSRIPFTALPAAAAGPGGAEAESTATLGQRVQLRILTSGRDLLSLRNPGPGGQRSLVLAAPDFGGPGAWQPLLATAEEGRWIAERLGAALYLGSAATTAVLQQARGPRVLHIASHGFFTGPGAQTSQDMPGSSSGDPLLSSGIVLAGANRHRLSGQGAATGMATSTADDDGYLTAKEAAQLQLDGTELVVLSACDTASGILQTGEGVYGLQRALTVAGARSTLLSLWKVDDDATAAFMQRYVALLKQGRGRMDALTTVQEEFRSNPLEPDWADHKFWAAWQLTGDGGPIPGL
ncbi:MAG: tetratricopeptide repeat protein [Cyanobium sp. CZS 25K]|nr:tetratricopeptide repeat protein [Cyanobium sp. CZS25K]